MVIKDCFALANDVSPQTPISFLSWIILQSLRQVSIVSLTIEKSLRRDKPVEGKRVNGGIGVDHEHIFIERRVHANNILDLVVDFELQWVHWCIEVNLGALMSHNRSEFKKYHYQPCLRNS